MSGIRLQEIYKINDTKKVKPYWVEILANANMLQELISILNYKDNYVKSAWVVLFDLQIIDLLYKNKKKIRKIVEKYKLVSLNLYPETILKLAKWWLVVSEKKKLKEILKNANKKWFITNIEIVENGMSSGDILLDQSKLNLVDNISKELCTLFVIDDMSLKILEMDKEWNQITNDSSSFLIHKLWEYLRNNIVWWIKIDLKIMKMIIDAPEHFLNVISWILKNIELLKWKYIIFEWVENEEIYNVLINYLEHYWLVNNNEYDVTILIQWYYFSKPKLKKLKKQ